MRYVQFVLNSKIGMPLNHMGLSHERRIVVKGQIVLKVDESGELRYNKHHNIEVQELMKNG